jgi:hypothetical protein
VKDFAMIKYSVLNKIITNITRPEREGYSEAAGLFPEIYN